MYSSPALQTSIAGTNKGFRPLVNFSDGDISQYYESLLLLEVKEENERQVLLLLRKLWAIHSKS